MRKILFYLIFLISFGLYAQETEQSQEVENVDLLEEKVKRFSAGVKVGVPNIVGLSFEGVTPLLDNRLAAFADFSGFNVTNEETEIDLSYSEFGANFYFGNKGKGFYAGLGAGKLSTNLTFTQQTDGGTATGSTGLDIKATNFKLGVKTGGTIYFRFEVGFGISEVPETIDIRLSDGTTETLRIHGVGGTDDQSLNIPGVSGNGILVGNFGFGLSF